MNDLINTIVALEWEDFQNVNNVGGRASCQNDKSTFSINRKSQFMAWNEVSLKSYLKDLREAKAKGRNLLMEKYARMMAFTHPDEYKKLEPQLPLISPDARALVDGIVYAQIAWQRDFVQAYPKLALRGRPVQSGKGNSAHSGTSDSACSATGASVQSVQNVKSCLAQSGKGDSAWVTSFETYLRGELLTYSIETLGLYATHIARLKQQSVNMSFVSMEYMVTLSGFGSLQDAEAAS